jgi:hypothetical protein
MLREFVGYVSDEEGLRDICIEAIDQFELNVLPNLRRLRFQVVHNDLNLGNVLLDKVCLVLMTFFILLNIFFSSALCIHVFHNAYTNIISNNEKKTHTHTR